PGEPAPWLHPHIQTAGTSQLLRAGPPAGARDGTQRSGFCPHALPLTHPRIRTRGPAVSAPAFSRSMQEPQTRLTPSLRRAPPAQSPATRQPHPTGPNYPRVLMPSKRLSTFQQRRPAEFTTPQDALARLPDPRLTHLVCLFPNAHHDGLRPTQLGVA